MALRRACCGCGCDLVASIRDDGTPTKAPEAVALCSSCWRAKPWPALQAMDADHAKRGHLGCHPRASRGLWKPTQDEVTR